MGKGGGGGHTPREAPDNLKSTQELEVIDAICEGPIEGPVNGLQSILINNTPIVDAQGNANIKGVDVEFRVGENPQTPLTGFEASGAETMLGAELKHDNPLTRTITSEHVDRLRFTFGVQSLVETNSKGDRNGSSVNLQIQIQRNGAWATEKNITIVGKTTTQFLASVVIDNLPPRPFNIRMLRTTADSTSDQLQNKTLWSSFTELIDIQQGYPNTAVIGLRVDAEQFGKQQVARNYHLRGLIVRVPSNYDPTARTYTGIWDGMFKPAYTDNPAWCVLDLLTNPRYGLGGRIGVADVDIWALYAIAQYCDQWVPDGFGGTEPRMTCNAYLTTQRKAYDVLSDFCSVMRCMPVWNGQRMTFVQDRPADKVWTYTNSNVVNGLFSYSFSALKDRHNAVEVRYTDPNNGWKTSTELVEDKAAIVRYERNLLKMDAFGCTSRGQAHRIGLWTIQTELLETQTVDFSVGAEGLRHTPGDIIEVCDNDYADVQIGGRIVSVDTTRNIVTLDRDVELPASGQATLNIVAANGEPHVIAVVAQNAPNQLAVSSLPAGVVACSVWGLKLPTLRQRLFRCVVIREGSDGTYAITAVQHVPEKEAIVDNGAHFDPLPGTLNSVIPPVVQHLVVDTQTENSQYQAKARWDTPRVVKSVSFVLRLTVGAGTESDPVRLVTSATTHDMQYAFHNLPLGSYTLSVRAVNGFGQQGEPTKVSFDIAAPEAPTTIELTAGLFQITVIPHLRYYRTDIQYEFWYSPIKLSTSEDVLSQAQYLGTSTYWIKDNLKPGHDHYFYVRSINLVGKSAFTEAVGQSSSDAEGILGMIAGKITDTQLGEELLNKVSLAGENATKIEDISKSWTDAEGKLNAMRALKISVLKDGRYYVAGIGAGIENTPEGMQSQILLAAQQIAMVDPSNGNTTPMFVARNGQIFMNEVFLKYLSAATINAPTITSGGNPPAFSLTPDGVLSARNASISGTINANSGTLNNITINQNCRILGKLSANQIEGDIVKNFILSMGGSVYIPAQPFARVVTSDNIVVHSIGNFSPYLAVAVNGAEVLRIAIQSYPGVPVVGMGSVYYSLPAGQAATLTLTRGGTRGDKANMPSRLTISAFKA